MGLSGQKPCSDGGAKEDRYKNAPPDNGTTKRALSSSNLEELPGGPCQDLVAAAADMDHVL